MTDTDTDAVWGYPQFRAEDMKLQRVLTKREHGWRAFPFAHYPEHDGLCRREQIGNERIFFFEDTSDRICIVGDGYRHGVALADVAAFVRDLANPSAYSVEYYTNADARKKFPLPRTGAYKGWGSGVGVHRSRIYVIRSPHKMRSFAPIRRRIQRRAAQIREEHEKSMAQLRQPSATASASDSGGDAFWDDEEDNPEAALKLPLTRRISELEDILYWHGMEKAASILAGTREADTKRGHVVTWWLC